jgi:CDP-4-dehydro-6-deoxyglucose reductase
MKPGDSVEMTDPLGFFVVRNPAKDAIFVATGTGIAPFRSMAPEYLSHPEAKQLTLIFGVRHEQNIYYRDDFEALAKEHSNFHFLPTLSRAEPSWLGRTGHVQLHLFEAIGDRRDLDVYICGLKAMVDDVRAILKGIGFDRKQIIFEKYD